MDITFVIVIKGILTLLLVVGALAAVMCGLWMYRNARGHERDHLDLAIGKSRVKARTAGAVIMATASIWASLAVFAAPTYEKSSDGTTIRVANAGYELKTTPIKICSSIPFASLKSDPKALKRQFHKAITEQSSDRHSILELNGEPAHYIANSVSVSAVGNDTYLIEADVKTAWSMGKVYFRVDGYKNRITFQPLRVSGVVPPNADPNDVRLQGANEESSSMTPKPLPLPGGNGESNPSKPSPFPLER